MSAFTRFKRSKDGKKLDGSYSIEGKGNVPTAKPISLADQVAKAKAEEKASEKAKAQMDLLVVNRTIKERFTKKLKLESELIKEIEKVKIDDYPNALTKLGYKSGLYKMDVDGLHRPLYYHSISSRYLRGMANHPGRMLEDFNFYIVNEDKSLLYVNRLANLKGYSTTEEVYFKIEKDEIFRLNDLRATKEAQHIKKHLGLSTDLIDSIDSISPKKAPAELDMAKPKEEYYGEPLLYSIKIRGLKGPIYYHVYSRVWIGGGGGMRMPGYHISVKLYKVLDDGKLKKVSNLSDLDGYITDSPSTSK